MFKPTKLDVSAKYKSSKSLELVLKLVGYRDFGMYLMTLELWTNKFDQVEYAHIILFTNESAPCRFPNF